MTTTTTNSKVRNFVTKKGTTHISVPFAKVKKHFNTDTRKYDVTGEYGMTIYATKMANKLRLYTCGVHLYATKDNKGQIVIDWKNANTNGLSEASATLSKNKRDADGALVRDYVLNKLGLKSMKFDTLK